MNNIPSWDELYMRHAYLISTKSKDPSTKIGAVLVKNNIIISEGYNGFPRGIKDLSARYYDKTKKYKYVAHAEFNAVINCARLGISSLDSILFTNAIPCSECCKSIIQGGIREIVIHNQYPVLENWKESQKFSKGMLNECNIPIRLFNMILNIHTLVNGKRLCV